MWKSTKLVGVEEWKKACRLFTTSATGADGPTLDVSVWRQFASCVVIVASDCVAGKRKLGKFARSEL